MTSAIPLPAGGRRLLRLVIRHLSGSRATEVEVIPFGPHRELILGRAPSAAVRFGTAEAGEVGRFHARLEEDATHPGRFLVTDLQSRNGTYLNGRQIVEPTPLRGGDILRLGLQGPEIEIHIEQLATVAVN